MRPAKISDDELYAAWKVHQSLKKVLESFGIQRGKKERERIKRIVMERTSISFTPPVVPDTIREPDAIIQSAVEHRERIQAHFRAKQQAIIPIHNDGKPFGIAQIPDQHMDNPGSNLKLVFDHAELIAKTDGLYAAEVGDCIDNFIIGKLETARREHTITVRESWSLAEHYHAIINGKLLAALSGNHTEWTKRLGGIDYLESIIRKAGVNCLYDADELYFSVKADNGRAWKYAMRHFFQGHSMWNAAHSVARYAMSHAYKGEDVVVAGHKHIAGYQLIETRGKTVHCVQTGSYKDRDFDDYCRTKGFMAQHAFLCPVMIHFPDTGRIHFIPELEEAIPYLAFLRRKK